jgi:ABC-type antimicrobial peptide transport system permease subunit
MAFAVPWTSLGVIFAIVYVVSLAATYLPARRAARVYPAEALRYE